MQKISAHVCILAVALTVAATGSDAVAATIDFEGLPDSTILTTQYSSAVFSNAIILTAGISLNEFEFPPYSGVNVVSDNGGPMTIDFSSPITSFGGYFTYLEPLTIDGFNAANSLVTNALSAYSTNDALYGDPGSSPNEFIQLSFTGGISSVTIIGDPAGGSFVLDDAIYTTASSNIVPEPHGLLLIGAGIGLLLIVNTIQKKSLLVSMKRAAILLILIILTIFGGAAWLLAMSRDSRATPMTPTVATLSSTVPVVTKPISSTGNLIASTGSPSLIAGFTTSLPTIAMPVATPNIITANTSTTVTVTVQITDPTLIPGSVNLLLLGATGTQPTILGVMQNTGGGIYGLQYAFYKGSPGTLTMEVSAAFQGQLRRIISQTATITAYGLLSDGNSGFQTIYPPVLFDLSRTTTFGGFLLQSSPTGVDIGGEGPEDDSNATTSGFSVVITPTPYSGSFDINTWLSTEYPYSNDTLTTTTVGGQPAYQIVFQDEVGAGEPTVVVYHSGYIFTISYSSTFALGTPADLNGLTAFNEVLQNFQFTR
jgi:hypothetical protein